MYTINFNGKIDKRLEVRSKSLSRSMLANCSTSIQSISSNRADQIGNYRLLHNTSVTEAVLIEEQQARCRIQVSGKTVLCVHDSSESNFNRHINRLKPDSGLGYLDGSGIGFKLHLSIAIDAKSHYPYGVSNLKLWARENKGALTKNEKSKLPITEKESYKWQEGCQASNKVLSTATAIVHIQDREGDIYEQIADFWSADNVFYIIRSHYDRQIEGDGKLWGKTGDATPMGSYPLAISGDSHGKGKKRETMMEVRHFKAKLKRPAHSVGKKEAYTQEVSLIETRELNPPEGAAPLVWRLLTSCSIETFDDALQVIEWYCARWHIEELFRVVKKENLDIEGSELESGHALRKLAIFAIDTGIKLFQLYTAREGVEEGETVESISSFSKDEFDCLTGLNRTLEGKTEKQQNPYKPNSNLWVLWILARLGGWKGYSSQRKAGMTTIIAGLDEFYTIYKGWTLKNLTKQT